MAMLVYLLLFTVTASAAPTSSVAETRQHLTELYLQLDALLDRDCDVKGRDECTRDLEEFAEHIRKVKAQVFSDAHATWGPHNGLRRYRMLSLHDRALQLEQRAVRALTGLNTPTGATWSGFRTNYAMTRVEAGERGQAHVSGPVYVGEHMVSAGLWLDLMKRAPSAGCDIPWLSAEHTQDPALCISPHEAMQMANAMSRRDGLSPVYLSVKDPPSIDASALGYRLPTSKEWRYLAKMTSPCDPGLPTNMLGHSTTQLATSRSQNRELTLDIAARPSQRWSTSSPTNSMADSACKVDFIGHNEHRPTIGMRLMLPSSADLNTSPTDLPAGKERPLDHPRADLPDRL
ncbi:MAG: hypothetical protein ACI9MC_000086 [Kiritimatiellia bacterium]|jgi:hypothetical protein